MSNPSEIRDMKSVELLSRYTKLTKVNAVQRYLARYDKNVEREIALMFDELKRRLTYRQADLQIKT